MNNLRTVLVISISWWLMFFSEWLFLITKDSFLSSLDLVQTLGVLVVSPLPYITVHLVFLALTALVVKYVSRETSPLFEWVHALLCALLISFLVLLLLENFSYTVFSFNMSYATGWYRLFYTLTFVGLLMFFGIKIRSFIHGQSLPIERNVFWITAGFFAVSLFFSVLTIDSGDKGLEFKSKVPGQKPKRPNIILFVGDSVVAENTSVYGYQRKTTPFLEQLAEQGLVAQNFFSNASHTTGALAAFYTGKLPTRTRMIYRPDILRGLDSYQHLPGILSQLGYYNIDSSIRYYADPEDLNLKNGFHAANGRAIDSESEATLGSFGQSFPLENYFVNSIYTRIKERVRHMLALENMVNAIDAIAVSDSVWSTLQMGKQSDIEKIDYIKDEISKTERPFFAHVHLLMAHGPRYWPHRRVWSKGLSQDGAGFVTGFYDDAIYETDANMQMLIRFLKETGHFENTIFIYTSDHGSGWVTDARLPLVIRFPGGEFAGEINHNTQLIDLAPTILDYMGIEKPDWMQGDSLLSLDDTEHRRVFTTTTGNLKAAEDKSSMVASDYSAPFFSLGSVSVIVADHSYSLDLATNKMRVRVLKGHTLPLTDQALPELEDMRLLLLSHLLENGYDVSSLRSDHTEDKSK